MREITFLNEDGINIYERKYWERIIKENLKIGIEVEFIVGGRRSNSTVIAELKDKLGPTNSTSNFGKTGTYKVTTDGSLNNGVELCTVGRRVSFFDMYHQYEYMCDEIHARDGFVNSRCGLHNHMLLDYQNGSYSALELNMPNIIFKNFVQLFKRHYPEIIWFTSTVNDMYLGHRMITRGSNFCKHSSLFATSIHNRPAATFKNKVMEGDRYKALNMNFMKFSDDDKVSTFHIEIRMPDGSVYPAQMAAMNTLFGAMMLKAAKLSEFGLMSCGTDEDWAVTKELTSALRNEYVWSGDDRYSRPPTEEQITIIKERGQEFIKFLSPEIEAFDRKAIPIMQSLMDKPISIMRQTMSDTEIQSYFKSFIEVQYKDNTDKDIIKLIATMGIDGAMSEYDWCKKAGILLNKNVNDIMKQLNSVKNIRDIVFDAIHGRIVER